MVQIKQFRSLSKTQIHFGQGLLKTCSSILPILKTSSVLIVTGRSAKKLGTLEILISQVKKICDKVEVIEGISSDPATSDVKNIMKAAVQNNSDFLIALGGGSVIDATKAASVLIPEKLNIEEVMSGVKTFFKKIPVIAFPTTAGTGAELSRGAIITWESRNIKSGVRGDLVSPDFAIVDPELTSTLTQRQKSITGFDILTHAIETYISKKSTPITEIFSLNAISDVTFYLPKAIKTNDIQAREKLSLNSALMGYNLANSSTCLPHRLQYPLGVLTKTEHAFGLAAIYLSWIEITASVSQDKFETISQKMSQSMMIENKGIIPTMKEFLSRINLTESLGDLGLTKKDCDTMSNLVSGSLDNDPWWDKDKTVNDIYYRSL